MKITLSPVRMDTRLTAEVEGEILTLNGDAVDLSAATPGAPLEEPGSPWIVGAVHRDESGTLSVTLILPHGGTPPRETLFPAPIEITAGPVPLPPYDAPPPAEEAAP